MISLVTLTMTVVPGGRAIYVPHQLPVLVSGGLGGITLLAVGAILAALQSERRDRAAALRELQGTITALQSLAHAALRHTKGSAASRCRMSSVLLARCSG